MVCFHSGEQLLLDKDPTGICTGACVIHKHSRKRREGEVIKSAKNTECPPRAIQCIYI